MGHPLRERHRPDRVCRSVSSRGDTMTNSQSTVFPDAPKRGDVVDPVTGQMVWIPGGTFRMGSDRHYVEEAPAHNVTVDGFWIDRFPITNDEFRRFVDE